MNDDKNVIKRELDSIAEAYEAAWRSDGISATEFLRDRNIPVPIDRVLRELIPLEVELRVQGGDSPDSCDYELFDKDWISRLIADTIASRDSDPSPTKSLRSPSEESKADGATVDYQTGQSASFEADSLETVGYFGPQQNSDQDSFGEYEIIDKIAKGGMGVVYKARHTKLNRIVALKTILAGTFTDHEAIKRFQAEAEAAAKLDHPGIVPVYEVGEFNGRHFFSMAFVDGQSLSDKVKDDGPLQPTESARLIKAAAEAIQFAHEAGVFHRDIKPHNILLDKQSPRITDFGLAKQTQADSQLTTTGQIMGTPSYMAPEQARGKTDEIGAKSDVYALGATLYFLLTGRPPFQAATTHETMRQVIDSDPLPPRKLNPAIPQDLETICLKCLRKEPPKRYENASELADDLNSWLEKKPINARPVPRSEKAWLWCRRNPAVAWSAVFVLLVSVIGLIVYLNLNAANDQKRAESLVNAVLTAPPDMVPDAIENLRPLQNNSLPVLESVFSDSERPDSERLNAGFALAEFGFVKVDFLLKNLDISNADHGRNFASAFSNAKVESLYALKQAANTATKNENWKTKVGYGVMALHLSDSSIAERMLRAAPEKNDQQTKLPDLIEGFEKQLTAISRLPEKERRREVNRLHFATACFYLDRNQEALKELDVITAEDRVMSPSRVWLLKAMCLARDDRGDEAKQAAEKFEAAITGSGYVSAGQTLIQAWLGNIDQANEQLEKMVTEAPEDAETHYIAACIGAQLVRICKIRNLSDEKRFRKRANELLDKAYRQLGYMRARLVWSNLELKRGVSGANDDPDLISLHEDADFQSFVTELFPPPFDPVERTTFISEFARWAFELKSLAPSLTNIDDGDFRSGFCLALGAIKTPNQGTKEAWKIVLENWYTRSPDGGTHSAARWALNQWDLQIPELKETKKPPKDRRWWHAADVRFVKISAGNVYGKLGPIVVENDFWLSDVEVTIGLFQQFIDDDNYKGQKPKKWDGAHVFNDKRSPNLPVQQVSWFDAVMFCNWLSWKLDLKPCYEIEETSERDSNKRYAVKLLPTSGIRLPSETEWEYACRALTTTRFSFGDNDSDLVAYGWYTANSSRRTQRVGTRRCNPWGLFDMHGNVFEWCWDQHIRTLPHRVYRGGSWYYLAERCHSSDRKRGDPQGNEMSNLGFRVARGPSK